MEPPDSLSQLLCHKCIASLVRRLLIVISVLQAPVLALVVLRL